MKHGGLCEVKPALDHHGYYTVGIYFNDSKSMRTVHRLVAEAFIPNPDNKPVVDHIDRNRKNNNVSNLRWATVSENRCNTSHFHQHNLEPCSGVCYRPKRKKYEVSIFVDFKSTYVGMYSTLEEAVEARKEAEVQYFGSLLRFGSNAIPVDVNN